MVNRKHSNTAVYRTLTSDEFLTSNDTQSNCRRPRTTLSDADDSPGVLKTELRELETYRRCKLGGDNTDGGIRPEASVRQRSVCLTNVWDVSKKLQANS